MERKREQGVRSKQSAFDQRKQHTLQTINFCTESPGDISSAAVGDKSPKGFVDERILPLCSLINRHPNMFTTSSCSGRICLWVDVETKRKNQNGSTISAVSAINKWLYVAHDLAIAQDAQNAFDKRPFQASAALVYLKMEPMILHVECRDLDTAIDLLHKALSAGFRNSGLTCNKADCRRWIVAIRSTIKLDIPIFDEAGDKLLLHRWVEVANQKMFSNWALMDKLLKTISSE